MGKLFKIFGESNSSNMKLLPQIKIPNSILYVLGLGYVLLFWRKLLFFGMVPFFGDTPFTYLPCWVVGKKLLTHGYFLWDPFRNMGQPFLAFPTNQAIYPLRFFSVFTDYMGYQRLFVLFHTFLASTFSYLLAKEWFKDQSAAGLAAMGLGFNGFFFGRFIYQSDFAAMAWVPAILFFLSRRNFLVLSFCVLMQGLAGFPPFFLMTFFLLIVVSSAEKNPKQSFI